MGVGKINRKLPIKSWVWEKKVFIKTIKEHHFYYFFLLLCLSTFSYSFYFTMSSQPSLPPYHEFGKLIDTPTKAIK